MMKLRKRGSTQGFVLLMVLVALVILSTTLVQSSRLSLDATLAANEKQTQLQRTWGLLSCERSVLPVASTVFDRANQIRVVRDASTPAVENKSAPVNILRDRVLLGKVNFDLVLADEDSKANLNTMYHASKLSSVQRELRQLIPIEDGRSIRLQPQRESLQSTTQRQARPEALVITDVPPAFRHWGEVFSMREIKRSAGDDRQLVIMTRNVTLFGRGPINVLRASDPSALAVLRCVIQDGQAKRLVEEIQRSTTKNMDLILRRVITDRREREQLEQMLTTSSNTFSLWSESTTNKSRQQDLAVIKTDGFGFRQTSRFAF